MEDLTYDEFINNILETRGRFACGDEYHERHHIVPRCMGGLDNKDNLIDLYAKEHFIAHKLLAKENPDNDKLIYAWNMMSSAKNQKQQRYEITPEEYEEVKKKFAEVHSKNFSGENHPMYGVHRYGENAPMYGKRHTKEAREKMSIANKNRPPMSEETREKLRQALSGDKHPNYGTHPSDETREKMRKAKEGMYFGENNPNYGNHKLAGENNPRAMIVMCIDTKKVYGATTIASEDTGAHKTGIRLCCSQKRNFAGGLRWRYIYDTTTRDGEFIPGAITLGLITETDALAQLSIVNNP